MRRNLQERHLTMSILFFLSCGLVFNLKNPLKFKCVCQHPQNALVLLRFWKVIRDWLLASISSRDLKYINILAVVGYLGRKGNTGHQPSLSSWFCCCVMQI